MILDNILNINEQKIKNKLVWQRNIMLFFGIYLISYIIYSVTVTGLINAPWLIHLQIVVMVALVFYVAYISYEQPEIFKGKIKLIDPTDLFKYKNSGLTESYSEELKTKLLVLLEEEKIYKQNDLNLNVLSEKLDTTRHNASQVINEHFNMNFFELINKYRINEAIDILSNDSNGTTTVNAASDGNAAWNAFGLNATYVAAGGVGLALECSSPQTISFNLQTDCCIDNIVVIQKN